MSHQETKSLLTPPEYLLFVNWFRDAAPYINSFRNKTFVIYFAGEVLTDNQFPSLIHDLTLLHSLGVKLVLIHGARPQIEKRLSRQQGQTEYPQDMRVTDSKTMQTIKESSGCIRIEIESLFSTSLKYTPMADSQINVVSGNFVTAKPKGIINGVDFLHTGEVRKIDVESINYSLKQNSLVLLSPIGFSPTGEIFNLNAEDLATESAIALKADKLIFIDESKGLFDDQNNLIHEMTVNELDLINTNSTNKESTRYLHYKRLIKACQQGVNRIHILDRTIDGALLLELFTREGIGTLISTDQLEDIRAASIDDVSGIIELITPLEKKGLLVKRSRDILETEINNFYVIERENTIIGCGALYVYNDNTSGELACLAISPKFQNQGRGEKLFNFIFRQAQTKGLQQIFTLTTQATHWFVEQGFSKVEPEELPVEKQALYNYKRNSAVYIKSL